MTTLPLCDRVVVVVGGTTGLGLSGARACVRSGARVVVVGRNESSATAAIGELGDGARAFVGDAIDPATAASAIALARSEFGRFDALYHVAGGSGRRFGDGPLDAISDEGWRTTLDLNLTSVFNSNRAAARAFLAAGTPGSVLNMSSVLAFSPSPRYFATHAYAATKAAIVGMTRSAAAYYAGRGLRFNAIAPALVDTPMAARASGDAEILDYVFAKQPLDGGRIGRAEDLDAVVVLLLSDQGKFMTGQVVAVDGGWTVSDGVRPD